MRNLLFFSSKPQLVAGTEIEVEAGGDLHHLKSASLVDVEKKTFFKNCDLVECPVREWFVLVLPLKTESNKFFLP